MSKNWWLQGLGLGVLLLAAVAAARVWADEQIEMSTYIPAPGASGNPFDRLHANRATIGDPYSLSPENPAEPAPPNGTLLVSKRVGVGTADPRAPLHILGAGAAGENDGLLLERQGATDDQIRLTFRKSPPGPAPVDEDDNLGVIQFEGYNGTSYPSGARIVAFPDDNWRANFQPTRLSFFVAPMTSGAPIREVMRITSGGSVGIGTTSPTAKLDVAGKLRAANIDAGRFGFNYPAPNTLGSFHVNFNKTFTTAPGVVISLHSAQGGNAFSLYTRSITTTGFDFEFKTSISGTGAVVSWIAIEA